ncbi:hypothetical protein SDRG_17384 [Saprolegnia diclina VS20]|uniref:Uncharacterized protein n=1 Tax=Saprolegnia diclina (strain VS20) TaxID=1156394 RepID=T0PUP6_SAPDV|nr:hypothetical protein SDRG_17384 [Saprolegnia diclina VS20]EQC24725.1 hypothetical protein SDRG_17384 [Saprolegnia diclina VS20]|eukprot:XP_008621848.1 hypothetical protein SDRG_17384 [Saprolegnia diclina VS20]
MRVDNLANDLADLKAAFAVRLDDISITTTNTLGCIESVASAIERATQETAATILEAHDNVLPRGMLVLTKKYKEGKPPSIPSKKYEGPLFLYLVDEVTHEILYDNVIYPIHFNTAGLTKRMVTEIAPGFQDALNWIGQPFQAIADAVAWMDDALRVYYTPPGTAIGDLHELIIKHDPKKSLCGLTRTVLAANNGRVVWTVKKRNSENRY